MSYSQGRIQKFRKGGVRTFESQVRVKRGTTAKAERLGSGGLRPPERPQNPIYFGWPKMHSELSVCFFFFTVNVKFFPYQLCNGIFVFLSALFFWGGKRRRGRGLGAFSGHQKPTNFRFLRCILSYL